MNRAKIAITLEKETVLELDRLVAQQLFPNRSQAIQEALDEKLDRLARGRLARECEKLDAIGERALAEEGITEDLRQWPEY